MSAPLTYGIAAKAKHADCAAFFFNWVATNDKARQIDVAVGGSNPGGPTDLAVPTGAAGSVTNERSPRVGASPRPTARWTSLPTRPGSIFAQGWTPELQKIVGGKEDAAGLLKAVQAEYQKELVPVTYAAGGAGSRAGDQLARGDARPVAGRRIPGHGGSAGRPSSAGCSCCPALVMYGLFVLQPLALTVQYSLYRWDGVGPATWVGLANYASVLSEPRLVETLFNAFRLVVFFSLIPVALGLVTAAVIHRVATGRLGTLSRTVLFLPQVIPLVAAGIIWGRLLSLAGLVNQGLTAIGLGDITRAWLGDFDTALPAVGIIGIWVLLGFCTVLLLTGMAKIDGALFESARLDGAGWFQEFRAITVPSVRHELGRVPDGHRHLGARGVRHRLRDDGRRPGQRHGGPRDPDLHPRVPRATGRACVGARSRADADGPAGDPPDPAPDPGRRAVRIARSELYAGRTLLLALIAVTIVPFLSIFTTALYPSGSVPVGLSWPADPKWGNFVDAFKVANMSPLLLSSVFIVVGRCSRISLLISTMAGFAIGLLRIPARGGCCSCSCSA